MLDKLRIMQANLNTCSPATESTLQLAVEMGIDLLVVQEPRLIEAEGDGDGAVRSVNHSSFSQLFPPQLPTTTRPRTMLYISRRLDAQINCITEDTPDPDILRVKITI